MSETLATPQNTDALDENERLRTRLGLRPWRMSAHISTDERPCPPWCVVAAIGENHEFHPKTPFSAHHTLEPAPRVRLTTYWAKLEGGRSNAAVSSYLEVQLRQTGTGEPRIKLVWSGTGDTTTAVHEEILRLTVQDAWDLIAALQYVTGVANGDVAHEPPDGL